MAVIAPGNNPEGSYLLPSSEVDPCNMEQVRNDVQHASRWNRVHKAIEILCGRISGLANTTQVTFDYDMLADLVPVQDLSAGMYMTFPGRITLAALRVAPPGGGTAAFSLKKNGIGVLAISVVGAVQQVSGALAIDFALGDNLQIACTGNTDVTAFVISLKVAKL